MDKLAINLVCVIPKKRFCNFLLKNKNYSIIKNSPININNWDKEISEYTPFLRNIIEIELHKNLLAIEFFHVFNDFEKIVVYKYVNGKVLESNLEELAIYLEKVEFRNSI